MDVPTVIAALGEPLQQVQERSTAPLLPEDFRDDDGLFLNGPLRVVYTGSKTPLEFPPAALLASRLIAGRVLNLDVNPHLAPLKAADVGPLWTEISKRLHGSGGFWLPGELTRFEPFQPLLLEGRELELGEPPWGVEGLVGSDVITFSVRPNGYPSVRHRPKVEWTYRVEVGISNRQLSRDAYALARHVRAELGGDPFEPVAMSRYPQPESF